MNMNLPNVVSREEWLARSARLAGLGAQAGSAELGYHDEYDT